MFIRFVVLCTFLACNFRRTTGTEVEMVYLNMHRRPACIEIRTEAGLINGSWIGL